jgi:formamidopyrimidine-DNA glycosylase
MPELAEVEITRRQLLPLVGQQLLAVDIIDPKLAGADQPVTAVLDDVCRVGKRLGFVIGELCLSCHLRMTGKLLLGAQPQARALLRFDTATVSFVDSRRFGTLVWVNRAHFADGLGPDLLDPASDQCWSAVVRSHRAIKAVLLDQTVIAGIGNYMVDEALWRSRIHPAQSVTEVGQERWQAAVSAARDVAGQALAAGGVSVRDYLQPSGASGQAQLQLECYGRAGQGCIRCHTTLAKTVVGGRGTTWCPDCQALDG